MGTNYNIALNFTVLPRDEKTREVTRNEVQSVLDQELKVRPDQLGKWLGPGKWNPFDTLLKISKRYPEVRFEMWESSEYMQGHNIWNICDGEYAHAKVTVKHLSAAQIKKHAKIRKTEQEKKAQESMRLAAEAEQKRQLALGKLSDEEKRLLNIGK